jgi:hypothetical protein
MKKFYVEGFGFLTALLALPVVAFMVQACGGGNNSAPVAAPPVAQACVGLNCPSSAALSPANLIGNPVGQYDLGFTGNKQQEYASRCASPYDGSQQIMINGVSVCRFTLSGPVENESIDERAILSPASTSGGLNTGIRLFNGDSLTIWARGEYSHQKPSLLKGCHNEFNGEGERVEKDGSDPLVTNDDNGDDVGLYMGLSANGTSFVSHPVPVRREKKTITVNAAEDVFVGYNTDRIECGNLKLQYNITRCMDAKLNTYPCPKE